MKVLNVCLNFLNKIIPKKKYIIFNSYPDFSDNAYDLYHYIVHSRPDILEKYSIFWTRTGHVVIENIELHSQTKVVEKKSLKGIWLFLRSQYIISTHGYFEKVKSGFGQTQVNLWHGCGYKTLTPVDQGYRGDIMTETSDAYKKSFSEIFEISEKNIYSLGYPRNDGLFHVKDTLKDLGINKDDYRKIIVWMPTYRKAALGHAGIDGSEKSFVASNLTRNECEGLNETLMKYNLYMIIKPHPMDAATLEKFDDLSNIACWTNKQLQEKGIGLYAMLAETDVLLSDYSSVVIDYLLLNKPIAMVLSDLNEYEESRGFLFQPVEEYFPGPIISTFDMFINYISNIDQINSEWDDKRRELKNYFHKYIDDRSSERITKLIFGDK